MKSVISISLEIADARDIRQVAHAREATVSSLVAGLIHQALALPADTQWKVVADRRRAPTPTEAR